MNQAITIGQVLGVLLTLGAAGIAFGILAFILSVIGDAWKH